MAPHCSTCCCQSTQIPLDTPELPDAVKAHILSNEPPSASDFPMLREYRHSIDPYLTRLSAEIVRLLPMQGELQKRLGLSKSMYDHLLKEWQMLHERQQHISGALSSLRRFPLETLQEIFLLTLAPSGDPDYSWFNIFDPTDSLWTIRRVCRKWRMATQYPHLWTGLRITYLSARRGNPSTVVREVLERSSSLPLRIHFSWHGPRESVYRGHLILRELVKHSERWQYASFKFVASEFNHSISDLRERVPKLEELVFHDCDSRPGDYVEDDPHPFEIAPSLTKANIFNAIVWLDCSQLKAFTSDAFQPSGLRVLLSSPNLTYLADHARQALPRDDVSNETRYLHSRLDTLLLERCARLKGMILPKLEHLEAGPTFTDQLYPSLPIISQFLHISQCSLLSLTIHNCELSIGSMSEVLQVVPGLQRLSININSFMMERGASSSSDEAMSALIRGLAERASDELSRPRLVPNLQSFAFKSCLEDPWRFMDASIVDMIHVRSDMESVSFTIHPQSQLPNLSDDVAARLRDITDAGFDVSIVRQVVESRNDVMFVRQRYRTPYWVN
ncbi:hypothetical protein BDZ89DRAFT_386121 [Hymenopellis radicata]|nr:hypothetical protein BDZ89DRAFT_386121 [Hymenopellis radicata]